MPDSHRNVFPRVIALGPGAAAIAWLALLVIGNLTSHPLIIGASFVGLVALAIRGGHVRLVVLSLVVGLGMLLAVPGIAFVDGSFELSYANGLWNDVETTTGITAAAASLLRVPMLVLAVVVLACVPAPRLIAAAGRLSPRSALLAGLAARMQPLLRRDAVAISSELASRGIDTAPGVALRDRARAVQLRWELLVSGLLERSFQTSAALTTRGFVGGSATCDPLPDPQLRDANEPRRLVDVSVAMVAAGCVVMVVIGRTTGTIDPVSLALIQPAPDQLTPAVLVASILGALIGLIPAMASTAVVDEGCRAPLATGHIGEQKPHLARGAPITMRDVEMTYPTRDTPALRVASIDIEAGSHVVVIGMSGSGKSTLLDVITGVAPSVTGGHCRGVVRVGVEEVQQLQYAHPIAAVFQEPEAQIFVGMVAEEIAFGLRQAQLPAMVIAQRVRTVLAELGISHLARRDCATLSGGELQRVLLAAALALQPSVLVLDEPTSQIDAASERRFWDAVAAARQARSLTIVTVEHRLSRVLHDADKVIVCVNGVASDAGPPHEIANGRLACLQAPYEQLAPAGVWTRATPRLQVRARRVVAAASSDHVVMRDMDFALMPGSIVTLEGSNGSGKSTLLRAIRGLGASDMDVFVDGHPRGDLRSSVGSVALLSQEAGMLVAGRSVRDAASLTAVQFDIDLRLIDEALTSGGLGWARNMDPASLSVGERQRLAIISATAHRPLVWLLDEPTRGMDVRSRRWVAMLLLAHAAAGGVVLVATHDSALAAAIATHRLRLDTQTGPSLMSVRRDDAGRPMEVVKSSEIAVVTT